MHILAIQAWGLVLGAQRAGLGAQPVPLLLLGVSPPEAGPTTGRTPAARLFLFFSRTVLHVTVTFTAMPSSLSHPARPWEQDYIYAVAPLLEDALMDRDLVHRQTAAAVVQHISLGVAVSARLCCGCYWTPWLVLWALLAPLACAVGCL